MVPSSRGPAFIKWGKKWTEVGGGVVKGREYVKAQSRCMMRIKDEALASCINIAPLRGARPTERHRPKELTVRTGLREGRKKKRQSSSCNGDETIKIEKVVISKGV